MNRLVHMLPSLSSTPVTLKSGPIASRIWILSNDDVEISLKLVTRFPKSWTRATRKTPSGKPQRLIIKTGFIHDDDDNRTKTRRNDSKFRVVQAILGLGPEVVGMSRDELRDRIDFKGSAATWKRAMRDAGLALTRENKSYRVVKRASAEERL